MKTFFSICFANNMYEGNVEFSSPFLREILPGLCCLGTVKQGFKPKSFAISLIFVHSAFVDHLPCAWSGAGHRGSVSWP